MRKVLGKKSQYYVQTNNAQVELFQDYFDKRRMIACGPTAAAMCLDIAGWPMSIFTPGEQPEDSILMITQNPANLKKIKERRNIDYDKFPPNEVPQVYDVVGELLYGKQACKFESGLTFEKIKTNIDNGIPMMLCGGFPCGGHYVSGVGYDDSKDVIIFNDPYPIQWENRKGYNREMDMEFFNNKMAKWRVDFFPYKKEIPDSSQGMCGGMLPVIMIDGIGKKYSKILNDNNIKNIADLLKVDTSKSMTGLSAKNLRQFRGKARTMNNMDIDQSCLIPFKDYSVIRFLESDAETLAGYVNSREVTKTNVEKQQELLLVLHYCIDDKELKSITIGELIGE